VSSVVLHEARGRVHWITINRPDRRNALNRSVAEAIIAALDSAEADRDCRAVVMTGAGDRAFCAGADLERGAKGAPFDVDPANPRSFIAALIGRLDSCELPLIARVNGHALAGGLGLVCACDLAVATTRAEFGTPESKVGLFPLMILPHVLRVLPRRVLMEMCLTGESIDAERAAEVGVVNYVVPPAELDAKISWLLARIVDNSPTAIRLGKRGLRTIRDQSTEAGLAHAQLLISLLAQTKDSHEGAAAFLEKRKPDWSDS